MSTPPDLIAAVRGWVAKAEEDYDVASNEAKRGADTPCGTVCFHAQQSVEKYLKALLVLRTVEFPKSHDLSVICDLLPADLGIRPERADLSRASRFAVETRYPDQPESFGMADATWAVSFAERLRSEIRAKLPPESLTSGPR
jgi:HEPN domain-containing protein